MDAVWAWGREPGPAEEPADRRGGRGFKRKGAGRDKGQKPSSGSKVGGAIRLEHRSPNAPEERKALPREASKRVSSHNTPERTTRFAKGGPEPPPSAEISKSTPGGRRGGGGRGANVPINVGPDAPSAFVLLCKGRIGRPEKPGGDQAGSTDRANDDAATKTRQVAHHERPRHARPRRRQGGAQGNKRLRPDLRKKSAASAQRCLLD